jgi:preprotein translocase subunit SecB
MQQFPLQLRSYFVNEFKFLVEEGFLPPLEIPEFEIEPGDILGEVTFSQLEDDPFQWKVTLTVTLKNELGKYPYTFNLTLEGYFVVGSQTPLDLVETLVTVNGPSLLYSSAREFILNITMRSYYPPTVLPTIVFANLELQKDEEVEKLSSKKRTRKNRKSSST